MFVLLMATLILSIYAQHKVTSNFRKFSKQASRNGYTGAQTAKIILDRRGMYDVDIQRVRGSLTDHYDPRTKTLRLSDPVYDSTSVSAVAVAAHEVGHAIQDNEGYSFLRFRSLLAPVVTFTSNFVFFLIFLGFLLNIMKLVDIGIIVFSIAVLFQVVTLPVELNASRRALASLETEGIVVHEEVGPARQVLSAAALTYIAAMSYSIVNLLRLIGMRNQRN